MNKIQENLQKYMEDPYTNIVSSGAFKVLDFVNLNKVVTDTEDDFLIFDNGGGRNFDIMFDRTSQNEKGEDELFKVKDFIEHLLSKHKSWIYYYQINNEQIILRKII